MTRDTLATLVNENFCPEAIKSHHGGNFERSFLQGTREEVFIRLNWNGSPPTWDECSYYFHRIIDDCDTQAIAPGLWWKGGGHLTVGTHFYAIVPLNKRLPPLPEGPTGTCDQGWLISPEWHTLTGRGWLNSGFGWELKDALDRRNLFLSDWYFRYEIFEDKEHPERSYEWKLFFNSVAFSQLRVQNAIREVMNYNGKGIECKRHVNHSKGSAGGGNATDGLPLELNATRADLGLSGERTE
ncbi:hypothetical protein M011DRAFT_468813 [Sporormia fimetaria CBS 119925]|uniref:Uncharacterized protein n=1 Tax=Sporormia fimetaria CBS 119925 TaxID=1340428 RepID=A0A6A6V6M8_9PLEO|nr:hypothetical protein M011DRAFT_468813 [Sporormia fimetaria CBS 119925]